VSAWASLNDFRVLAVKGRVDFQAGSMTAFEAVQVGQIIPSNGALRLLNMAKIRVQVDSHVVLDFTGPAKAKLLKSLVANGAKSETVVSEMEGTVRVTAPSGSVMRMSCGSVQLQGFLGKGHLSCQPDSQAVLVWMEQGRVEVIRGDAHTMVIEPGRVWRLQKTDLGHQESWLDPALLRAPRTQGVILLDWSKQAPAVQGTRWDIGSALEKVLLKMPGLVARGDSLEWHLAGQVERFEVLDSINTWTVRLAVQFELRNAWYPFQVREFRFDQQLVLENNEMNRLKLLKLLPLDPQNNKIKQSGMGTLIEALRKFIEKEALDPFKRGGFVLEQPQS